MLQGRRKALHEQTGHAIEQRYSDRLDECYSELAYHYSRSSNTQKAVDYLQLAGQQAVQRSANSEAINHLMAAVDLLKLLPGTAERDQQELRLQLTLGVPLLALKGYAAPEVVGAYSRARELSQLRAAAPQLFSAL